jgi:hypothetical protein
MDPVEINKAIGDVIGEASVTRVIKIGDYSTKEYNRYLERS